MRWTLVLVACACLGLFLATGRTEAQQPPGAPTIGSVTAGTNTLTISWSAPAESGGTPITAYDLQYIRTDDDETDPANWTLLDNVWTTTGGGTLQHVVGDLLDGLSYDLQVRARNSEGSGDWSDTHAASTNDHDFVTSRSSLVPLGSSLPGYIASGADADADTFRISVPPGGGYLWVYTTGEVDTNGVLAAGNRDILDRNEDGWLPHGVRNFSIRHSVGDGTYYFRVQGQRGSTGAYRVHARLVTLPGATAATAQTVTLGEPALGRIQLVRGLSEDNYFTFTLTATTDVAIMASGFVDVIGELRDSGQTVLGSENGSGFLGADGFLLRRSLPADTYYVRVRARAYNGAGPYVLLIDEAGDAGGSSSVAATPLPFGHPQVARISSDTEEDYYRFTLDAETYVRFLAQPLGDSFALEATLYDDQNTDLSAYTVDRADYARHGEPYAAGILEKLEAGTYTLRIKAPSGETGGPYLVFAQVDTDQAAIIAGCKATTDAQTNALTDPLSGCQWPVKNTNQYGGDGDDINIESVWAAGKLGAGVNIAIVDNGIHAGHEDLVDNIVAARNHDYYGFGPDALATHGTKVAGLIAARDNDIGIRGVAPRASIYVYNLTADEDKIADNEADAMTRHMADTAVSNNSWSFPDDGDLHSPTAAWEEAVERGVTEGFGGKGVFYVWAAGNGGSEDNSNLDGRANFYAVTAACATGWRNRITDHSERGSNLWVCAPAGYSSELRVSPLVTTTTTGHRYSRNQGGASAAAAIVSGVAALVRAENPDLTWRDVKLILAASASRNDYFNGKWEEGARKYRSTSQRQRYWYSHNYGFGTVDAAAAVGLAAGWTTNVPPLPPLRTVEAASGPVDTPLEDAIVEDIRPGSTVSSTITLPDGYVEFIEFIEVEVTMAHSSVRDLRIVLESPSGAVSVLSTAVILDHQSPVFDGSFRFGSARHLGEDPGGTWTLRVTDRLPGHSGTFASWKIKAYGHSETAGYPPAPTATSGMRTLTIDWDAPTDIGGSAVTSYDLRYIRDASGKTDPANWTELAGIGTDDTGTYEIMGLGPGAQYDVQVRAVNDTGPGPWSESLVVRSSLEPPFAPSLTGVTPRDQGLGATWTAPTEDGGSEITSYDLRSISSDPTEVQTFLAWTTGDGDLQGRVAGLTNGVKYDVQVRARNAIDVGDWSETLKGTPDVQNRDPEFPSSESGARTVAEDLRVGGNVGARVAATDPDGDRLTYSIRGTNDLFEIDATNGQLRTKVELDADEGVTSHTLTVEVSDMLNSSDDVDTTIDDTIEVTVAVTNVNEPPMVEGTTAIDHAENEGTALANASYSATDPERANIIWSLGGDDKGFFAISDSGVLSFAAEPDFDARPLDNTYEVTVRATEEDDGDPQTRELTGTLDVIVTLSNFDEPPEIDGPGTVADYPENSPTTTVVGSYRAADPEGAGVTWSDLSGNDAGKFEFSNTGVLTFKVSPNFEQQPEYEVTLNAFDGGLTGRLTVTVTIADVNEPPVVARRSGRGAFSIAENSGTDVGAFEAMDPEGQGVTWSLATTGDHGRFEIDAANGALSFKELPDYESSDLGSDKAYNVTVRATEVDDGDTQTLERTGRLAVTVAVTDVNEPPTVTENATPSVDENTTAVATYRATDPDERATITWSVEDPGASDFTITNAGALSFASAPNYEVKSSYTVTVRASDGTNDVPHDVTVTVTDVDEREVLGLSHRTPLIGEEFTAAFEEGTGDNVDNVQPPTWAWARSTSKTTGFTTISGAAAATYLPAGDDRERYLRVTVSYNDGHGQGRKTLSATSEFATAATRASNTPPTFPSPLFTGGQTGLSVRENAGVRTVVGVAPEATDMQGGTLRYSLAVSGFTSDPPFGINPTSRQIRVVRAVLDHEDQDSYSVTVTVVDEFDATATATFDIIIEDVNEPPVAVADPAVTTEEDTPVTFDVLGNDTDPDEGDTLTVMTITTQPGRGRVVADPGTQMLTYTPAKDDHDTYTFMYTARDDDPVRMLTSPAARVTVTVTSVNDPPKFETEMTTRTVSESAQPGDEVGTKVEATDVDDITLTYRLSGASDFVIDDTGQIRVAPDVALDREHTSSYEVTVTASDRLNESDSITVTINVSDVPEPPTAVNDTAMTDEDQSVRIDVLANDTDPDTEKANLMVSVRTQPLNGRAHVESDRTIRYTPTANYHGPDSFTYRVSDGSLSDAGSVTVTVEAVNDAPAFAAAPAERSVPEDAEADDNVGAPVTATDVDNAMLTYRLSGADSGSFNIDSNGQIAVATGVTFDIATQETYVVTVTADDGSGEANATATVEVTITVTAGPVLPPVIIITGGGGGGGGGSGPSPSEVDFEWNVTRDIEELDGGNDRATGMWSDGTTLWVADNADGAGDAVYAYDLASGERVEEREFDLAEANRAPRGIWSDRSVAWVSDSGRERLFAYDLATGERLEEREFALAEGNSDARGIWSDEETIWVLDSRADALFVYDFESGELLGEYELDAANDDPRGVWSDGVTIWVSDHGAKRLFAYRLPVLPDAETDPGEEDADDDARELERVRDEEFSMLSRASNNSPRGIWSDGDVMYVADESDDKVYSYNMPDAIDARLASLTLSGVDIGEFDPGRPEYEAVVADGVTETTVEAGAMQPRTDIAIDPPDADTEADGYQVALEDLGEITVTVISRDGSRTRVYRVRFPDTGWDPARDPWPHCLRGAVSEGFSLVVYEGGSVAELVSCAESRDIVTVYVLHEGVYVSYILGAPDFVNAGFVELFPDGLPPITPLIVGSNGPPSADPFADLEDGGQQPWPECLRGAVSEGFSLVVYEGGSVDELEGCARSADITALYALSEGEFVSYILGAPDFVTQPFRDLFADGVPLMTPLVAGSGGQPRDR